MDTQEESTPKRKTSSEMANSNGPQCDAVTGAINETYFYGCVEELEKQWDQSDDNINAEELQGLLQRLKLWAETATAKEIELAEPLARQRMMAAGEVIVSCSPAMGETGGIVEMKDMVLVFSDNVLDNPHLQPDGLQAVIDMVIEHLPKKNAHDARDFFAKLERQGRKLDEAQEKALKKLIPGSTDQLKLALALIPCIANDPHARKSLVGRARGVIKYGILVNLLEVSFGQVFKETLKDVMENAERLSSLFLVEKALQQCTERHVSAISREDLVPLCQAPYRGVREQGLRLMTLVARLKHTPAKARKA